MKLLALLLLVFTTTAYSNCLIRVQAGEYPPLSYKNKDGSCGGMSVDMSRALVLEAGCSVKFVEIPWKRALHLMEIGKLEMLTDLSFNKKRAEYINFLGEHRREKVAFIVNKDSDFVVNSLEDFKLLPKFIGVVSGYFYGNEIDRKLKTDNHFFEKITYFDSATEMVSALKHKRISGFFLETINFNEIMKKEENSAILKEHSFSVFENQVFFGISKLGVNPQVYAKLKDAYIKIKKAGVFDEILQKY